MPRAIIAGVAERAGTRRNGPLTSLRRENVEWLSDEQQFAQLGNLTAHNDVTDSTGFPGGQMGSISTIAGNYLAAKILSQLQEAISYQGQYFKLNVLFADFYPLMSFFALTQLPSINPNFYGTPAFGSVAVFEVFSYTNTIFFIYY